MPGVCSHDFYWPQRASNGRYYQTCRLCGSVYEYDWRNMGRAEYAPENETHDQTPLRLLVELEPAHRVFLNNLRDTLQSLPDASTLRQWSFWRGILVNSGAPWRHFGESLVGQLIAVSLLLIISQIWVQRVAPRRRSAFDNSQITYYKPDGSFPALRGSAGKVRPAVRNRAKAETASRGGSIRVAPERAQAALAGPDMKPPDIKLKGPVRSGLVGSYLAASNPVTPVMPLASTGVSHPTGPGSLTAAVAPPPEIIQGTSRQLGLPRTSVVAPAPEMGGAGSLAPGMAGRGMNAPVATVIGPPPLVQAAMYKLGEFNIGGAAVVAPAPRLPMGEQRTAAGNGQASLGSSLGFAVPPPPSAPGAGMLANGRLSGGFSGGGVEVVPPAPSIQSSGGPGGGGRLSSLPGGGMQVVPPAPSAQGAGDSGTGRRGGSPSLANAGVQGVPPAPSVGAAGDSDHGGRQMAMNVAPVMAASPVIANAQPQAKEPEARSEPPTEEMPLRLIGLAMALPNSSYFSNYEVYIAERKLRQNFTELVKLVYVYLPYQRRLSEYGVDNSKIYKLKVSRDQTCDESLMQMTWPETDRPPDAQNVTDAPGLSDEDKKSKLPCYRTTADDYRKAISRR